MRRWVLFIVAVAAVLVIATSGLIYSANLGGTNPTEARDAAMQTVSFNYPDLQPYIPHAEWEGGLFGVDSYSYTSGDWTVKLNQSSSEVFDIALRFERSNMSADWLGTYINGVTTETRAALYGIPHENTPQDLILIDVFTYMRAQHSEPEPYAAGVYFKGNDVPNPDGMVGSTTYLFTGNGWNVTFVSPVVPDPLVQVYATLIPIDRTDGHVLIYWEGTWHNGTVIETIFRYTEPPNVSAST